MNIGRKEITIKESDLEGIGNYYLWYHLLLKIDRYVIKTFNDYGQAKSFRTTFHIKYDKGVTGTSMKKIDNNYVVFVWDKRVLDKKTVTATLKKELV